MNTLQKIQNYINRYAPSEKKIKEYLSRKNHTWDISATLKELWYNESLMCDLWIRTFIVSHKWKQEMKEKLMKKWFHKDLIEEKLESSIEEIEDWKNYEDEIKRKIEDSLNRGKSRMVIEWILIRKYPYFKNEIRQCMEWKMDTLWLEKEITKYLSKYDISDFKQKAKFYAALERKWFHYKNIRSFLERENE